MLIEIPDPISPQYFLSSHLPTIGPAWEDETGKPEWLGWATNTLLARVFVSHQPQGHHVALRKMQGAARSLGSALAGKNDAAIRHAFWHVVLVITLPIVLGRLKPAETDFGMQDLLTHVTQLRFRKEAGERITSEDWNKAEEKITRMQIRLASQNDRKASSVLHRHYQQLTCLLDIAKFSIQKNTHTSLANAIRNTLNVMEMQNERVAIGSQTMEQRGIKPKPRKHPIRRRPVAVNQFMRHLLAHLATL